MILKGKNVNLRALEPSDIDVLYQWENDTDIWGISQTSTPFSRKILKDYLDNVHLDIFTTKQVRLMIENNISGIPLGTIEMFDFDPQNQRAGIGILVYEKENRNRGIGRESLNLFIKYAFDILYLNQIFCNILTENKESVALFENLGFQKIGIKKKWIRLKDGFKDEYMFQLINTK
ncbi:GNAT family N-acetyltransferase [Ichthyobacterium seriolicida]|uniref:Acetyltransferase n=1 Tax=Ichthyobacterium seriolicida TaxID=242600 RepID=A0A1J1EAH2_9FLAO|nr:GNAT family N-acetyltransferase [Ichthyobacterium seriolicida]BAV94512.1 acetyltransferase [Ichthyobacterium seriolicida]